MPARWSTIAILATLVLALLLLLPAGMLWMLRHPPRAEGSLSPATLGLTSEDTRLVTSDGVELDAWLVEAANETASAIVVAHGYPADKADVLPAVAFLAEDHHLVLFDHRGLGASEGQTTLGVHEDRDVRAGIDAALAIDGVERVGLLGFSMGGAAAIQTAGDDPRVDAVLAQAAYAELANLAPEAFDGFGPLAHPLGWLMLTYAGFLGLDHEEARPAEAIGDIQAPILLVHGSDDATVGPDHAQRLAEAADDAELWIVDGATHGAAALNAAWDERVGAFLEEHLGP